MSFEHSSLGKYTRSRSEQKENGYMSYELDSLRKKLVFLNLSPDEGAWLQKAFELACNELCARGIYIHIYI